MTKEERKWDEEAVIGEAAEIVSKQNKGFDIKNFGRIRVLERDGQPFVSFIMPVCYIPLMSEAYYGVGVMPQEKFMSFQSIANPKDHSKKFGKVRFFIPTEKSEKAIDFVLKAMNESEEVGDIDKDDIPEDTVIRIYSGAASYKVEVESFGIFSHYEVSKVSGKISGGDHEHLVHEEE